MAKIFLRNANTIDNKFYAFDFSKIRNLLVDTDYLYVLDVAPGVMIILSLESDLMIKMGVYVEGAIRYLQFNEMNNRSGESNLMYFDNGCYVNALVEDTLQGPKSVIKSFQLSEHKTMETKVEKWQLESLQVALLNHPSVRELVDYILKKLEEAEPGITNFLRKDKRFAKMESMLIPSVFDDTYQGSGVSLDYNSELVVDNHFLQSKLLETSIELPSPKTNS